MQLTQITHTLYYMATIILTGGGSAGHCAPNLALIPHLKNHFENIYYIGSSNGIEKQMVEKANIQYFSIPCAKLKRKFDLSNLTIPFKVLSGINQAKKLIEQLKPDVIFSKGGYVAVPVVIAGHKKHIPVISHESDYTIGLANKITTKYCKTVLTTFKETAKSIPNGKYVGSPLKDSLFTPFDRQKILDKFNLSGKKPIIVVTGGSLGATPINKVIKEALDDLLAKFDIIHVCGKGNLSKVQKEGYFEREFLSDIEDAFKICSIAITRAGSNTLFELLSLKKPCVLIPLPKGASRGDQVFNAQYFQKKGLVTVLPQEVLTKHSLLYAVDSTYANRFNLARALEEANFQSACPQIAKILAKYGV